MSELRRDPIAGRWVIIATERGRRPGSFGTERSPFPKGICPLCPGHEGMTPPEIAAVRGENSRPDTPGWHARVIPNLFPALEVEGALERRGLGLFDQMSGVGAHEVLVESPHHERELADLDPASFRNVLLLCVDRIRDLRGDRRLRYLLLFKNHGSEAGASLEHTHSQLIAMPIVPRQVAEELEGARRHFRHKERCIFCDVIDQELHDGARIVSETEHFVVIEPFAARCPFETWILPRRHTSDFDDIGAAELEALAVVFRDTLQRLKGALEDPAYNFMLHSGPLQEERLEHYHWHIEIMPKLIHVAGFEWGSGFFINPTAPEEAARFLREVKI